MTKQGTGGGKETVSKPVLYSIMAGLLFFGTLNTLVMKFQDEVKVNDKKKDNKFNHPYVQCANMFLGELTCLFVYFIKVRIRKLRAKRSTDDEGNAIIDIPLSPGGEQAIEMQLKTNINPLLLGIPALFDIGGSTLLFVALTQCAASVFQMMRGFIVIVTASFAMIFLGRKQYSHHFVAMAMITIGVAMVGYFNIKDSEDSSDSESKTETTILGVLLLLIAQLFTGGQYISEEKLLSGYELDPFYVVGLEGLFGCIYYAIILPLMQLYECPKDGPEDDLWHKLCTAGEHKNKFEDTPQALQEMADYPVIILQSLGIIVSIACFNACGVAVTKYASAPQRSTVDTCRTLFIWIISIMIGFETFIWQELIGFFLLVLGTLIYNEIIIVPLSFMNSRTKVEILKRATEGEYTDDPAYLSSSPQAMYNQAGRNKNLLKQSTASARASQRQKLMESQQDNMFIQETSSQDNTQR